MIIRLIYAVNNNKTLRIYKLMIIKIREYIKQERSHAKVEQISTITRKFILYNNLYCNNYYYE